MAGLQLVPEVARRRVHSIVLVDGIHFTARVSALAHGFNQRPAPIAGFGTYCRIRNMLE